MLDKRYDTLCIRYDKIPKTWELLGRKADEEEMYTLEDVTIPLNPSFFMVGNLLEPVEVCARHYVKEMLTPPNEYALCLCRHGVCTVRTRCACISI